MDNSPGDAAVVIEGLNKSFRRGSGRVHVFEDLNLSIGRGTFVAVIGPSGGGKSTLLRLVAGLVDPDSGSVTIGGKTPAAARRAKRFGFVPQTPALLPWKTVHRNVALLDEFNRSADTPPVDVSAILERVGLTSVAHSLPDELSGGMRQRVALARAFALRPPVLLMDEPFSALDEITRSEMRFLLLELWRDTGATVLFVTHNIDEAIVLADRVIVLGAEPARIVSDEPVDLERPRRAGIEDDATFHDHTARLRSALFKASAQ